MLEPVVYTILLLIGAIGFGAMVLLGFMHGHSHGDSGHAGHHGAHDVGDFAHGNVHAGHHGHLGHGKFAHGKLAGPKFASKASRYLLISPMDLFAFSLGAGATGILLSPIVKEPLLAVAAAVGALVLNYAVVKPLMGLFLRFVSRPSEGLEGMLAHEAEAVSAFDGQGRGLVKLILDDEIVQILGTLESAELASGVHVSRGDRLTIIEIDPKRNICRVSREMAAQLPQTTS